MTPSLTRCRYCSHKIDKHTIRGGCMNLVHGTSCGCTWAGHRTPKEEGLLW